ncbi:MAG: protein-glutamate O-methyltransferase CheR [Pseudomonadota bacterium]
MQSLRSGLSSPMPFAVAPEPLSDREFAQIQQLLRRLAGIHLSAGKKALVCSRLCARLRTLGISRYCDYFERLCSGSDHEELQTAVDLLTTNKTSFFREPRHFDFLRERLAQQRRPGTPLRVWSAACSSGEEAYSAAMTLADAIGTQPWEVVASDISMRMLARARSGIYPLERARTIPPAYLRAYCLKGVRAQAGSFQICPALRARVRFQQVNLHTPLPKMGPFDLVLLRNVMIYFEPQTKREVVHRVAQTLRSDGHLLVGHSESLNGIGVNLQPVSVSIYRKP